MTDKRVRTYDEYNRLLDDIRDYVYGKVDTHLTEDEAVRIDDALNDMLRDIFVLED